MPSKPPKGKTPAPGPCVSTRGRAGPNSLDYDQERPGCASIFLDSGSFSLWKRAKEWAKTGGRVEADYYRSKEFFKYLDAYAGFVTKYKAGIDHYANVDAIGFPEETWRNQKYLEDKYGLNPVPCVHYRTDPAWLQRYIDGGYKYIALGGLVGSHGQEVCRDWIDRCFALACGPDGMPKVKIHGFGVTSIPLMLRYCWWSVDSSTWTQCGAWGGIIVPPRRGGAYKFDCIPYTIKVSDESPERARKGRHFATLTAGEQRIVQDWLDYIGVPLGGENGYGVINRHSERKVANLTFFELFRKALPKWPWKFSGVRRKGLF